MKLYTLEDLAVEVTDYRRRADDDAATRSQVVRALRAQLEAQRRQAEAQLPVIPAGAIGAALPAQPIFGYVDPIGDKFYIQARSRDRIWVSGWVASQRCGAPVREVRLRLEDRLLGSVGDFYSRPDVAAHFARNNLLHSGWRTMVYLPRLKPGEYRLLVEATDQEGCSGALDPWPVRIRE